MDSLKNSEIELETNEEIVDKKNIDDSDNESVDNDYDDGEEDNISESSDLIEFDENIADNQNEEIVKKEDRITRPFLTKYELVRIIGTRRKQLSLGAKPMIKLEGKLSINEIVDEEIKQNMVPLKIKRPLPDSNKIEIWEFEELEKSHLIN